MGQAKEYLSPMQKLVRFFERSRDGWKQKCVEVRRELKLAHNQIRAVEKSREFWRGKAKQAAQDARAAKAEVEQLQATGKKKRLQAS